MLRLLACLVVGAVGVAGSLYAEVIKPDLRCGPPIPRDEVTVLDGSELDDEQLWAFVEQHVGPVEVVKEESIQARSAFGKAVNKADKRAAALGCSVAIVVASGKVVVGAAAVVNPASPLVVAGPIRRDQVMVLFARPVPVSTME